jgi:AAA+ ATPase superfamily predicted ATPase
MENQVLGYQSPLYGRRTAQFKIHPFDYAQTREYFSFSGTDCALLYGITGGIPLYMSLMDSHLSVEENIKQSFLSSSGYMFEEPANLIKQECREPAQYNAIIRAIAGGASRLSSIASKVGLETALCSSYIAKLISIGIVKKEHPFREETGKKTIYRLDDSMFRFWYRFIPDNISLIQHGETDLAFEQIQPLLPAFMGDVFEDICLQYLWELNIAKKTPILFTDAGRWWGNNHQKREECEIDIIAANKDDAIFAECKWTNEPVRLDILEKLLERSELFNYKKKFYYIFAKTGFTSAVRAEALKLGNVTLVEFMEMG